MKRFLVVFGLMMSVFLLSLAQVVQAEGNVGFTYSQVIDDRSLGLTGDYTKEMGRVTFEADGQLQSGDIHNFKLNTDFTFDVSVIDLKLLIENRAKGYTLGTLGREQSVGLAFTAPVLDLNLDVGIGGKNASPFGVPSAYDTLVSNGFSEMDLAGKGLEGVNPALKGLPFKEGNALNAFVSTGFSKGIFDIDLKGIIELVGDGDKQHQLHANFKTGGSVYGVLVTTGLEVGLMRYQDAIFYETAVITSAGFEF